MSKIDDGGPAFPFCHESTTKTFDLHDRMIGSSETEPTGYQTVHDSSSNGMSLRDWFAGQALVAAGARFKEPADLACVRYALAEDAYLIADAMIAERSKADT